MTEEDIGKLLATITVAYPNYQVVDPKATVKLYLNMLEDYPYNICDSALKAYIITDTTGFAPSIGKLIEKINQLTQPQTLNELEAWTIVSKALRNGYYGAEEEFERFPPIVKKVVGSPSMLQMWATDEYFNESVVSSNFMRAYRQEVEEQKELQALPADVKALIANNNYSNQLEVEETKIDRIETAKEQEEYKAIPLPQELEQKIANIGK